MHRYSPIPLLSALVLVAIIVTGCVTTSSASTTPTAAAPVANAGTTPPPAQLAASTQAPTTNDSSAATPIAVPQPSSDTTTPAATADPGTAIDPFAPVVNIVKQVQPSVVTVITENGLGSGIVYSADGMIVTNNHVVAGATSYTVAFASGEQVPATLVGTDPIGDVAVLKVDKTGLPAAQLGDSDRLVVGELAVAVGSPLGFQQTVTSGVVSALHRVVGATDSGGTTTVLTDLIQTDASINEGNSGGALCDGAARLVGINTLIASQSGGSVGLGFAIPANTAVQVADDIIAHRPISHPYIGVLGQTVTAGVSAHYKLAVVEGAYVTQVIPGSPAAKAGIKPGDIIVAIDGKPVKSMDDMVAAVRSHGIGDEITVTYFQGTTKKTVSLTVGEKPSSVPAQ